jgi:hypothetical protein
MSCEAATHRTACCAQALRMIDRAAYRQRGERVRNLLQGTICRGMRCALLPALLLLSPLPARAECTESRIVEYEDRVEVVCVGEPLTEAQKKAALEEEKRQLAEALRQKVEETKREKEAARASKTQAEIDAANERKRAESERTRRSQQPVKPQQAPEKNRINLQKF